jgi:hypothetical protein
VPYYDCGQVTQLGFTAGQTRINKYGDLARGFSKAACRLDLLAREADRPLVPGTLARTGRRYVVVAITALCAFVAPIGLAFVLHFLWIWAITAGIGASLIYGFGVASESRAPRKGRDQLTGFTQGTGYFVAEAGWRRAHFSVYCLGQPRQSA